MKKDITFKMCWLEIKERIDAILPYKIIKFIKKILSREDKTGISKKYIKNLLNKKRGQLF